jgi:hypothetical protein
VRRSPARTDRAAVPAGALGDPASFDWAGDETGHSGARSAPSGVCADSRRIPRGGHLFRAIGIRAGAQLRPERLAGRQAVAVRGGALRADLPGVCPQFCAGGAVRDRRPNSGKARAHRELRIASAGMDRPFAGRMECSRLVAYLRSLLLCLFPAGGDRTPAVASGGCGRRGVSAGSRSFIWPIL